MCQKSESHIGKDIKKLATKSFATKHLCYTQKKLLQKKVCYNISFAT